MRFETAPRTQIKRLAALLAVSLFILGGCGNSKPVNTLQPASTAATEYPGWFLNPPESRGQLAAGFSRHSFLYPENSLAAARRSGEAALQAQSGMRVTYNSFWEITPGRTGRETGREVFTDTLGTRPNEPDLIAEAVLGSMHLALFGSTQSRTDSRLRPPGRRPAWVDTPPQNDQFSYGTGAHPLFINEQTSWKQAELNALKNLASTIEVRVQQLDRFLNQSQEGARFFQTDVYADWFEVAARWRDERNVYVLVRARAVSVLE
ncbi:MAG: hypothetical protein JJU35_09545 [Balneolales bacterium]|nr:hypothetical protein [Balneolales bacterium]